jgi:2-oxoglutarate ferredoxin oxidoreductase subunit alpha
VLLASDLHLSEDFMTIDRDAISADVDVPSLFQVEPNGNDYKRYAYTPSGVSPRAIPGQPGLNFIAGSDEHDEKGHLVSDVKAGIPLWVHERVKMMDKRMRKLEGLRGASAGPLVEGDATPELTFVAWGSTVGAIRDAMRLLHQQGRRTRLVSLPTVYPVHGAEIVRTLQGPGRRLLVEANYSGQLGRLLRAETGLEFPDRMLKYDGEPFYPREIVARALEVMGHVGH